MRRAAVLGALFGVVVVASMAACKDDYTGPGGSGTAGAPQPPGAIALRVTCAGAACGQAGALVATVDRSCATQATNQGFTTTATIASNAVLAPGQAVTAELGGLPHGYLCVSAFLDADHSGGGSAGDAYSSAGSTAVDVPAGGSVTASVVLDLLGNGGGGGGAPGSVALSVGCSGYGCGHPGTLHGTVKECGFGGAVLADRALGGQNLTAGFPVQVAVGGVPTGDWCATAWLDANGNGIRDNGDVIPSSSEVFVSVAGGAAAASITLDQTQHL